MSISDHDKYICSIRSQVRGRADFILTDITTGESQVIPLRWRQLMMLIYEAIKALDAWPLSEAQQSHPSSFSNGCALTPALEVRALPSSLDG